MIFLVDFFSDESTVLLLAFSIGVSTTEAPSPDFVVRFGGAFAFSGVICQSD
jgi:hypothetical protein